MHLIEHLVLNKHAINSSAKRRILRLVAHLTVCPFLRESCGDTVALSPFWRFAVGG